MRAELTDLASRLVAIDSVNPALVAGGAGEAEIAAFVADWGRAAGLVRAPGDRSAGVAAQSS